MVSRARNKASFLVNRACLKASLHLQSFRNFVPETLLCQLERVKICVIEFRIRQLVIFSRDNATPIFIPANVISLKFSKLFD